MRSGTGAGTYHKGKAMTMQGSELRAARKRLGWTQARMATELDMSTTFIGLMERCERPIERRTALAVKALELDPGSHLGSAGEGAEGAA